MKVCKVEGCEKEIIARSLCCTHYKKTPRKLRGTYEDNAPELDHIIPISKGGTHTADNLQCLCRRCNGMKLDKDMSLFLAELIFPTIKEGA